MPFKSIFLTGRPEVAGVKETLSALIQRLSGQELNIYCSASLQQVLSQTKLPTLEEDKLSEKIDLIIVVGGDGSFLQSAHHAVKQDIPVIGINRGRLGFLTDICPDSLEQIDDVLAGRHTTERRFIIESSILGHNPADSKSLALNDIVIQSESAQMITFDVYVNDQLLYAHRADGLIIATPTGSTAYALSGGGPILQPQLPALAIVPMFPHTLSTRPIVVGIHSAIRICISNNKKNTGSLSCDGGAQQPIAPGDEIQVNLYDKQLTLLHPETYNYYETLREKLNWEQSARKDTD